ncbi:hypothetical protein BJ875DRAFT_459429 [Amylocarpus encephaloides]|uniref:Glucose-methanol-choline oxidoreductase N-terminal domain-containing protein n=1 Tax=Amylocarpus encephaloides TaxID=45428 RepID=A0A9P7YKE3_9HELO|nr:hypothetical protein BJ875DRAFT_459429 [Amylocarpus encephaloides]
MGPFCSILALHLVTSYVPITLQPTFWQVTESYDDVIVGGGSDADNDAWEQLGNEGWEWRGIGSYFRSTNFTPPSAEAAKNVGLTWDVSTYSNRLLQIHLPSF